jgi:hypothetical protein
MDIFKEICKQNIEDYGRKFENWIVYLVNQNSKRTHFLYELLQNAEDAGAKKIEFRLYKDRLEMEHDGRPFDENDIRGICGVGESTKIEDMIGKFGIGFKSVFAYTIRPSIYSGNFSFAINNYIMPERIESRVGLKPRTTLFVLSFNKPETVNYAYNEIFKAFTDEVTPESILFLNKIESVKIMVDGQDLETEIKKSATDREKNQQMYDIKLTMNKVNKKSGNVATRAADYLLFSDSNAKPVKIAYQLSGYEIKAVHNSCFYSYLPTTMETHQNFYIHAPFNTTPSRDGIYEGDDYNKELMKRLGSTVCTSIVWLRSKGYLSINSLSLVLPIYKYPETSLFYELYKSCVMFINSAKEIIPTNTKNSYRSIQDLYLPASMNILEVFDDLDLKALLKDQRKFWIAKEILLLSNKDLLEFLINEFSLKTLEWKDLVRRMTSVFLESKEREWYEKLFDSIESYCLKRKSTSSGSYIDVHEIPLIRLDNGKNIVAFQDGIPQAYINNPDHCDLKIHQNFISSNTIKSFYAGVLEVPEYNILRTAIDKILPKYENPLQVRFQTDKKIKENIEDLKTIKEALNASKFFDGELLDKISKSYIVTDGKEWYKPSQLHITQGIACYGKTEAEILNSIGNIVYLADQYSAEAMLDVEFFSRIGCHEFLKKTIISEKEYLFYVKKFIDKEEADKIRIQIFNKAYKDDFDWNVSFEGIPELFNNIDRQKSLTLARYFNKNFTKFIVDGKMSGADDYLFNGANVHCVNMYSAIGLFLTYCPWLYSRDGRKVSSIEIEREQLDESYEKECKRLVGMLRFQETDAAVLQLISRFGGDEKDMLQSIFSNHEELSNLAKIFKKGKMHELREKNKEKLPPQQAFNRIADKSGRVIDGADRESTVESVNDVARRKAKIEKSFSESMNYKINLNRHLHYTYQESAVPAERSFLEAQYEGHCQICDKTIIRHDGKTHFHAINIIKTGQLAPEYVNTLGEAWNSLCLCPNCASEYKVGPKDMSDFRNQVLDYTVIQGSKEYIVISIILQGKQKIIKYVPKHFLALKTALEFFE